MSMGSEVTTTIVMKGRDEASQAIDRTRRSVGQMDQNLVQTRRTTTAATNAVSGMGRQFLALGAGALGVTAILAGVKNAMTETASSTAAARFVVEGMGPAAKKSLQELEGSFSDLAREFQGTETDARGVFTTLIRDSGGAEITIRELRGTMALARATGIEFGAAADVVAEAIKGNLEPLRNLTGEQGLKSLNEAFERAIKIAPEATTIFGEFSAGMRRQFENLAQLDIGGILEEITTGWKDYADALEKVPILGAIATKPGEVLAGIFGGGGEAIPTTTRTQAIQQVQISMNIQGNVIMNEDQQREFTRRLQELLDENDRRR